MLDLISLDQLRTSMAAADTGSFSVAGRKTGGAQSVVSHTLANLEGQIEVTLFDRSGRYPVLTAQGHVLLEEARAVAGQMDLLKARARGLSASLEPELDLVLNVLLPTRILTLA